MTTPAPLDDLTAGFGLTEAELSDDEFSGADTSEDSPDTFAEMAPRGRRAWRPEAGAETAAVLRLLASSPWQVGGRDDETISAVRRNESAVRAALSRPGWVLHVDRDLVRLAKSPPPRPEQWAQTGPNPLVCSWFFLIVAAAESMPPRAGIGQLVAAARGAAAEAVLPVTGEIGERRAIVVALRLLEERGVIEPVDGNLDGFVTDELAPVLLAIHHSRLLYVVANPGTLDPAEDPAAWLAEVRTENDPARRMRRRLLDDTCAHAVDLDEVEAQWLRQRVRGDDGAPLAAAFGLTLERRAEGAAFVLADDLARHRRDVGPFAFPAAGTVPHAALLLTEHAAAHGSLDVGPGSGWRSLTDHAVRTALSTFSADPSHGSTGWSSELSADITALTERIALLLEGLSLLRRDSALGRWHFAPVTGRWDEPGTATRPTRAASGGRRGRSGGSDVPVLFTTPEGTS